MKDAATRHLGLFPMFKASVPDQIFLYLPHRHTGQPARFLCGSF